MGILFKNTSTKWVPQKTKNVGLEKFLEWNHPQTLLLLSRRGPRCPDARLSHHYISQKMICCNFSNFCRKKSPGLKKEIYCTYWMNLEVLPHDFCKLQPTKMYKNVRNFFVKPGNFFLQKFEKLKHVIFELMECLDSFTSGHPGPLLLKSSEVWGWFFQKLFQGYIFCFLGDLLGRCIFEQYAHETNLK